MQVLLLFKVLGQVNQALLEGVRMRHGLDVAFIGVFTRHGQICFKIEFLAKYRVTSLAQILD